MLKPFDRIDFLVVYTSKSYIRTFKLCYTLKVSKSFKTKCIIERIDDKKHLVCIDVFDNQDPNLHLENFFLSSIVMLSNAMQVARTDPIISNLSAKHLKQCNLIYFYINQIAEGSSSTILRGNKQVFYDKKNKLDYNHEKEREFEKVLKNYELTDRAFLGYLDQENRIIKSEFQALSQNYKAKNLDHIKFYCKEFLDFEILWYYTNQKEESRNLRLFSKENDDILLGQHSIISTPINSISYKHKKSKNATSPVFSIRSIIKETTINHDFKEKRQAK